MRDDSPEAYIKSAGIKYKKTSPTEIRFPCPSCNQEEGFDLNLKNGLWRCKRSSCQESGNLYKLKTLRGDAIEVKAADPGESAAAKLTKMFKAKYDSNTERWEASLWRSKHAGEARDYLKNTRKLDPRVLKLAKVGWIPRRPTDRKAKGTVVNQGMVAFPYFERRHDKAAYNGKARWVPPEPKDEKGKTMRYTKFKSGELGLYAPLGLQMDVPLLIVGGEIDALSLVQTGFEIEGFAEAVEKEGGAPCSVLGFCPVSLPNGEGGWQDVWTEMIREAEDVVVALDSDKGGRKGTEGMVAKLGIWRCRVSGGFPGGAVDANDALVAGDLSHAAVMKMIRGAKSKAAQQILSADEAAERVADQLTRVEAAGISTGLPKVDELLGGLRPWEINVVSGHTGSGKSTFCFQVLGNVAAEGHRVLLCPFEGGPEAGLARMARQRRGEPLRGLPRDEIVRSVKALGENVYVLDWVGVIKPSVWRETLRYCVSSMGFKLIVVDLLNFMVPRTKDRWDLQDQIVLDSQTIISDRTLGAAHMLLLAHPSTNTNKGKNRDDYLISLADLKGHSDLVQDCQGVLQIYRPREEDREEVKTHDGLSAAALISLKQGRNGLGKEGIVELGFDDHSATYTDWGNPSSFSTGKDKGDKA